MTGDEQIKALEQIEDVVRAGLAVLPYASIVRGRDEQFRVGFTTTDLLICLRTDPRQWEVRRGDGGVLRVFDTEAEAAAYAATEIVKQRTTDRLVRILAESRQATNDSQ